MSLEDKIYKILEDIPNVYEGWYREDINSTHTTFLIYYCSPDNFADDDYSEEYYAIQIDTWGTDKDEVEKQYEKVKKLFKDNDFLWLESNRDYENDTKIYHYSDRFNTNIEVEG